MNKRGFVFIETIVSIVILASILIILYTSFNKILQSEKTRGYYDNISFVYRTWNVKNLISNLNIDAVSNYLTSNNLSFKIIGTDFNVLFEGKDSENRSYENNKIIFSKIINDYEIKQLLIIKGNLLDNLKTSLKNCKESNNCTGESAILSEDFVNFINSIYLDVEYNHLIVINYENCNSKRVCSDYYSWVGVL